MSKKISSALIGSLGIVVIKGRGGGVLRRIPKNPLIFIVCVLFLAILACNLPPQDPDPGTLGAEIAEGNVRYDGTGNVTYIGCQDPTAVVSVQIGGSSKEIDGTEYYDNVNPAAVYAITQGMLAKTDECIKISTDDKHDWPAEGIYYPKEGKIVFTTCTQNKHKAVGDAYLVGEGFEGEYACYDKDTDQLIYSVAFSAYDRIR
jgi:hypothetical protein